MGRDQFFVSGRVASLGLGRTVSVEASPEEIGQEIIRVLHDPEYRKAAGDLAQTIDPSKGLATAVTLVEEMIALPGQRNSDSNLIIEF
jgi:UDP:flavonoid glycosyltransferase YjiC (YdhE family)